MSPVRPQPLRLIDRHECLGQVGVDQEAAPGGQRLADAGSQRLVAGVVEIAERAPLVQRRIEARQIGKLAHVALQEGGR